jgi:hypothetical protein
MNKEKLTAIFMEKLAKWEDNPERQTSGYAYEKTYLQTMREIEEEVFKETLREEDIEGGEKKTSYVIGRNKSK